MEARGTSGGKFRSGSMAFLFAARPAGVVDFRAQPSLKPEEAEVRLVGRRDVEFPDAVLQLRGVVRVHPIGEPARFGRRVDVKETMAHLRGGAVGRHVDHRLNQPMAAGRRARKGRDAVIVALTFLDVLGTDTERDGGLGAPAVLREEQAQRMPLLVVDEIAQGMADVVHRDIRHGEGEPARGISDGGIEVARRLHRWR